MKNLICFVIIMLITISVFTTTLVVDQFNGPYYSINAAYNDAVDDDTILIYPATYYESIDINKELTLQGVDQTSSKIHSNDITITVNIGNVFIKKLNIQGVSIGIKVEESTVTIENCIIEDSSTGIYINQEESFIKNCIFRNCTNGINFRLYSTGIFSNNIVYNCSDNGIYLSTGCCATRNIYVDFYNNIIFDCDVGIRSYYINCIGIIDYNCFYNNATYNGYWQSGSLTFGPGNLINTEPLFFDSDNDNFYLQQYSPCIDTGNPNVIYNDLDGTRNDMGNFGGQTPWGQGNPTVLDIQIIPTSVQQGETFDIEATGQVE